MRAPLAYIVSGTKSRQDLTRWADIDARPIGDSLGHAQHLCIWARDLRGQFLGGRVDLGEFCHVVTRCTMLPSC